MKLQITRRKIVRALIYWLCLSLVLIAIDLVLVRVRQSVTAEYETTRIVAPVMPDGRIDYLTATDAYFARGVTPENNAAVLLLRAFGPKAIADNQPSDGITSRIGMSHLPESGEYLVPLDEYKKSHPGNDAADVLDQLQQEEWPIKVGDVTRQWIDASSAPLELVAQASSRERYFIPFLGNFRPEMMLTLQLKHMHFFRESCRALLARSVLRLERNDFDGFRADTLALMRLGPLVSQASTLVEWMQAGNIQRSACNLVTLAATHGKISVAQAKALLDDLRSVHEVTKPFDRVDHGERFIVLDSMQWMAQGGPGRVADVLTSITDRPYSSGFQHFAFSFLPVPFEQAMRQLNKYYDGMLIALQQRTYAERSAALNLVEQDLRSIGSNHRYLVIFSADFPAKILMPSLVNVIKKSESWRADRRMMEITLALVMYRGENGKYPEELAELAPKYLPAIPEDGFRDGAFDYSRTKSGFRLRSVGPDMKEGTPDDIIVTAQ